MKRFKPDALHKFVKEIWRNRTDRDLCERILDKIQEIAPQHPLADATQCSYSIYCLDAPKRGDFEAYRFAMSHAGTYLEYCVKRKFYGDNRKSGTKETSSCEMNVKYQYRPEKRKTPYKNGHRLKWH